jgi:hypothetical protein
MLVATNDLKTPERVKLEFNFIFVILLLIHSLRLGVIVHSSNEYCGSHVHQLSCHTDVVALQKNVFC